MKDACSEKFSQCLIINGCLIAKVVSTNDGLVPNNDKSVPSNDGLVPNNVGQVPNNDELVPKNDGQVPND